jgi:DNA-binding NtrC family response regulator
LIDVDVRLVAATNRDLPAAIAKGEFREELYYRVNVIAIRLPPLRERVGDVKLLTLSFLRKYGQGRITGIDDAAMAALERYRWPGNVRELQNVIERACALADGTTITERDLPDNVLAPAAAAVGPAADDAEIAGPDGSPLPVETDADLPLKDAKARWMESLEGAYLRDLLARHDGNISAAAKAAGIDRKTFHRLINKYQIRS